MQAAIYEDQYKDEIQRGQESANSNDGEPTPKERDAVEVDKQMRPEKHPRSNTLFVQTNPKGFGQEGKRGAPPWEFRENAAFNASQPPSQESTRVSRKGMRKHSPMRGKGPLPTRCTQTENVQPPEIQPPDEWDTYTYV